ncbi:Hypp3622 [Branchiostoma lanceolatum]|uniref:Hypp3622 protein n=1 Tax=Branchiostoma lanceolatum TaxID=7740 RepID=A0A8K0EY54_BRALA|nr:Hypp3622 [Branchiostoma lanceolatum]
MPRIETRNPNPAYPLNDLDPNPMYEQSNPNTAHEPDVGSQRTRVKRNDDPYIKPYAVKYQEEGENNIPANGGAADDNKEITHPTPDDEAIEPYAVAYMEEERTSGSSHHRAASSNTWMNVRRCDLSRNDADQDESNLHGHQVPSYTPPTNPADVRNALNPNPMYRPNVAQQRTWVCTCRRLSIAVTILTLLIFGGCFTGFHLYISMNKLGDQRLTGYHAVIDIYQLTGYHAVIDIWKLTGYHAVIDI